MRAKDFETAARCLVAIGEIRARLVTADRAVQHRSARHRIDPDNPPAFRLIYETPHQELEDFSKQARVAIREALGFSPSAARAEVGARSPEEQIAALCDGVGWARVVATALRWAIGAKVDVSDEMKNATLQWLDVAATEEERTDVEGDQRILAGEVREKENGPS